MNCEEIYELCMSMPHAVAKFPFDEHTLVITVADKMFAVIPLDRRDILIVKCNPERAVELRERYNGIEGAFHFNKKHWNQIALADSDVPPEIIKESLLHSYRLVYGKLPRKTRETLPIHDEDLDLLYQ